MYADMAFQANKDSFARRAAASHFSTALHAYIDGREKAYAVHDATREIAALFGPSAALAVKMIGDMMRLDADDPRRLRLVTEAVQLVERQTRRDHD